MKLKKVTIIAGKGWKSYDKVIVGISCEYLNLEKKIVIQVCLLR